MTLLHPPLYPLKLPPSFRERIWGSRDLSPFFGRQQRPVGEAWYSFEENVIANGPLQGWTLGEVLNQYGPRLMGASYQPAGLRRRSAGEGPDDAGGPKPYFPILTKLLFTTQVLSVQVHPDDSYALEHEGGPGKTEMWYIVDAKPGAKIALGLSQDLSATELRRAAETGEIEQHLNWIEAKAGQTFFVPPGTIHALGPGLVLYEVQQNSDLTYRLYDFGRLGTDGRPRELHIEQAVQVARQAVQLEAVSPFRFPAETGQRELLAACSYFAVERLVWEDTVDYPGGRDFAELLMFLEGQGRIGTEGYQTGDCFLLPSERSSLRLDPAGITTAVRSYVPDLAGLQADLSSAGAERPTVMPAE